MSYLINRPMRAALLALAMVELANQGVAPTFHYVLAGVWGLITLVELLTPEF